MEMYIFHEQYLLMNRHKSNSFSNLTTTKTKELAPAIVIIHFFFMKQSVTVVACKRPWSFCQNCGQQISAKHVYTSGEESKTRQDKVIHDKMKMRL